MKILQSVDVAWDQDKNDDSSKTTSGNDWSTATLQKYWMAVITQWKWHSTYYSGSTATVTTSLDMTSIRIKNRWNKKYDCRYNLESRVITEVSKFNNKEEEQSIYRKTYNAWTGKDGLSISGVTPWLYRWIL